MRQPSSPAPMRASTAGTASRCASTGAPTGRRRLGRLGDERGELGRELAEDLLQARGGQPEVVVGQQRVVRAGRVVEARRVLARELDVAPQRRREGGEVARPRARPARRSGPRRTRARSRPRGRPGTRRARSKSRRATRTISASSPSSSAPSSASSHSPTSSAVARSCASRSSVASCSPRPGPPSGGIIVRWSQAASRPSAVRSLSSAIRVRRASMLMVSATLSIRRSGTPFAVATESQQA